MSIQLYNTLSGKKEPFVPLHPGKVRFYACGPTVYNLFHLGNGRMFVAFDTIRRYLEYRGYQVDYVQNFTDVDDKIIQRANADGTGVREIANRYIEEYFRDADALGIKRATVHPRATESIPEIIRFIGDLVTTGYAYVRGSNVYFDTSAFPGYGKLSHRSVEDMRSGFRIDVNEEKQDPADFALWKAAKPGEESWPSPWGEGRPGWHIECSVMSSKYLGDEIDIHAGGQDLIFPHHENEIAQSEAHSGHQFVHYWLHNGPLNINGEKMSKSLGNFIMTRDLLLNRPARVIRFFLLSAHYRHPLNYTDEGLEQAVQGMERIDRCLRNLEFRQAALHPGLEFSQRVGDDGTHAQQRADGVRSEFVAAMDDDFNTADAIAAIFEGVRLANTDLEDARVGLASTQAWLNLLRELLSILGLHEPELAAQSVSSADIEAMIAQREAARKRRDFAAADKLRQDLENQGVILEDTLQGTRWFRK
ncbi:cysteine--tRNA ligase [Alicyclobacillaceae bacterium I2511]|nr:cysteine--tRNA ligase [Alicyclobacillaceae bacterium I2511]